MRLNPWIHALLLACAKAATCGEGDIGDGICPQRMSSMFFCCSSWGWCQTTDFPCPEENSQPTPVPMALTTSPGPTTLKPPIVTREDSRLIAYMANWQSCPTAAQLAQYTHVVIAFAVSYSYSPLKNKCSETCEIATPSICGNAPNPALITDLHATGKKVLLSFGGAGMGGSWYGDSNDCWEYCFGRETQVVDRITDIVNALNLDGVDIDYEYFYEDFQNGSAFQKGAEALAFLREITTGLRNSLAPGSMIVHAPLDTDMVPGSAYFDLLKSLSSNLDFVMPQYYNGYIRPAMDGVDGTGYGRFAALPHYTTMVNDMFQGDATKVVFGFCISDCSWTGSNTNGEQAAEVMSDLSETYICNGGAFFWLAGHDINATWSTAINQVIQMNMGCSNETDPLTVSHIARPTKLLSTAPRTAEPTFLPTTADPTSSPTSAVPTISPTTLVVTLSPTTANPTSSPTSGKPTISPSTADPTPSPTTADPTSLPTTDATTIAPTGSTSELPSIVPTPLPSSLPSTTPSGDPSALPSASTVPSDVPSVLPSILPTPLPSALPSDLPSNAPSDFPSTVPSDFHTKSSSDVPSAALFAPSNGLNDSTGQPETDPTQIPTATAPTKQPQIRKRDPTVQPTEAPAKALVSSPTLSVTNAPTASSGSHCCSWDYASCGDDDVWCNRSETRCEGCGGFWLAVN